MRTFAIVAMLLLTSSAAQAGVAGPMPSAGLAALGAVVAAGGLLVLLRRK